jgi:two-component sensor histidine kinase
MPTAAAAAMSASAAAWHPLAPLLGQAGSAEQAAEIERLRAEAGERSRQHELATRELDSFAHSVSHDLRAPLRVVDGFATILLEDYAHTARAVDALGEEHIRRIIGAGARMNAMIDTLLAMSRMTSRDLERERVNLSQLARELADELKAGDRSRRVEFSITPDLVVEGDRTLLRLVLQNLIGNAFKFTGRVAVAKIAVGVERDEHGASAYHVRDNGAGFDPRFAEKMFGLFQRFHSANEFPGTGVGLATVQRIVRKHGGRIWAESQPGEGATFHFTSGTGASGSAQAPVGAALATLDPHPVRPAGLDRLIVGHRLGADDVEPTPGLALRAIGAGGELLGAREQRDEAAPGDEHQRAGGGGDADDGDVEQRRAAQVVQAFHARQHQDQRQERGDQIGMAFDQLTLVPAAKAEAAHVVGDLHGAAASGR